MLLLLAGGQPQLVQAQAPVTVSGTVQDETSGERLPGATVRVVEQPGVGTGVAASGAFTLTLPAGTYTLEASFLGYKTAVRQVVLTRNQRVSFQLARSEASLAEVVVTARRRDATSSKAQAGVETLDMRQIAKVPVLFGEKDILKTLTLLPGVKSAGEGTTGFSVRGGNLDQNLVLFDDAVVYNPSHLLGFFSAFNADALRDLTIYKGGMPAQYGGRLSSVVDVQTRDGDRQQLHGSGGIGLIASRLALEGPLAAGKGSFLVAARRTYADVFLQLAPSQAARDASLYFYDLNAKASYTLSPRNRLAFSGYLGRDALALTAFGQRYGNQAGTLRFSHDFSNRLTSYTSLIYSKYDLQLTVRANEQDFTITSNIRNWQLKQDAEWTPRAGQKLRAGVSATHYVLTPGYVEAAVTAPVNATETRPAYALETAVYVSHEWAATDRLDFTLGLRASGFRLLGPGTYATYDAAGNPLTSQTYDRGQAVKTYLNLEPRLAASYQLTPTATLKAGYARNVQNLHLLSNSLASSPTDLYVPTSRNVRPELADQLSAGYLRTLSADKQYALSAEVYYKWLQHQIDYRDGSQLLVGQDVERTLLYGRGRAYGLELLLRKDTGRLTGWVGYTLSKSQRQFAALNAGAWFNARQDRPHELSVVAIYQLTPTWSLSGTFVASTGNAVTYPVGKTSVAGQTVSVYGPRNADRLPAYRRLDVGATYEKPRRAGRRFHGSWNFSVYNVLGRQNPFLITFETVPDDPTRTQAVQTALFRFVPSATYNFTF
jgi:outer membrane cobalamin receptor